jgi:hypothetical protein
LVFRDGWGGQTFNARGREGIQVSKDGAAWSADVSVGAAENLFIRMDPSAGGGGGPDTCTQGEICNRWGLTGSVNEEPNKGINVQGNIEAGRYLAARGDRILTLGIDGGNMFWLEGNGTPATGNDPAKSGAWIGAKHNPDGGVENIRFTKDKVENRREYAFDEIVKNDGAVVNPYEYLMIDNDGDVVSTQAPTTAYLVKVGTRPGCRDGAPACGSDNYSTNSVLTRNGFGQEDFRAAKRICAQIGRGVGRHHNYGFPSSEFTGNGTKWAGLNTIVWEEGTNGDLVARPNQQDGSSVTEIYCASSSSSNRFYEGEVARIN